MKVTLLAFLILSTSTSKLTHANSLRGQNVTIANTNTSDYGNVRGRRLGCSGYKDGCWLFDPCCGGLSCHPVIHKCYHSPRRHGEPCMAGYSCGNGLSCQPGHHKCYHSPRREGEPCSAGYSCGGDLTCEAGSHKCRKPGNVGDSCHLTRLCGGGLSCQPGVHKCYHSPRKFEEPCSLGYECGSGLSCHPGIHKCYHSPRRPGEPCSLGYGCDNKGFKCAPIAQKCLPENVDLDSKQSCAALQDQQLSDLAETTESTMSYGAGWESNAAVLITNEVGTVYGGNGEFGCYVSVCFGVQTDISVSAFSNMGIFNKWDNFAGPSFAVGAGAETPIAEIGFGTVEVFSFADYEVGSLIGNINSFSMGVGLLPVQANGAYCYTEVMDATQALSELREYQKSAKKLAEDMKK